MGRDVKILAGLVVALLALIGIGVALISQLLRKLSDPVTGVWIWLLAMVLGGLVVFVILATALVLAPEWMHSRLRERDEDGDLPWKPSLDLRACPKCYSPEVAVNGRIEDGKHVYFGVCGDCGFEGPRATTIEQAIKEWNALLPIVYLGDRHPGDSPIM